MSTLFVSDVHLSPQRPAIVSAFVEFVTRAAQNADAVYILGDLFDEWLGDDDDRPPHLDVQQALGELTGAGVPVAVVHGNHDFLLGSEFEERTGCRLIPESEIVDVYGTPALLMHGDSLCTRDLDYQSYRRMTRDPRVQQQFLSLPLPARVAKAASLRHQSREISRLKPEDIMDVAPEAVQQTMREHRVRHLVHGHTHRPAIHELEVDGEDARRMVLGDWYEVGSVLVWNQESQRLTALDELEGALE